MNVIKVRKVGARSKRVKRAKGRFAGGRGRMAGGRGKVMGGKGRFVHRSGWVKGKGKVMGGKGKFKTASKKPKKTIFKSFIDSVAKPFSFMTGRHPVLDFLSRYSKPKSKDTIGFSKPKSRKPFSWGSKFKTKYAVKC